MFDEKTVTGPKRAGGMEPGVSRPPLEMASAYLASQQEPGVDDQRIIATDVKRKLLNLRETFPDQEEYIYEFGNMLSSRASNESSPEEFYKSARLVLRYLDTGLHGTEDKPFNYKLAGYPEDICDILSAAVPMIAEAAFGKGFGDAVSEVQKEVHRRMEEKEAEKAEENILRMPNVGVDWEDI